MPRLPLRLRSSPAPSCDRRRRIAAPGQQQFRDRQVRAHRGAQQIAGSVRCVEPRGQTAGSPRIGQAATPVAKRGPLHDEDAILRIHRPPTPARWRARRRCPRSSLSQVGRDLATQREPVAAQPVRPPGPDARARHRALPRRPRACMALRGEPRQRFVARRQTEFDAMAAAADRRGQARGMRAEQPQVAARLRFFERLEQRVARRRG